MKTVIEMARECGFWLDGADPLMPMWVVKQEELEHFASLVAEHERNACAKIVEESSLPDAYSEPCLKEIAKEIKTRVNPYSKRKKQE